MTMLAAQFAALEASMPVRVVGRVEAMSGLTIEAVGLALPVGTICRVDASGRQSMAEIIGFRGERALLMPLTDLSGIARGNAVENLAAAPMLNCSDHLLKRVINGLGQPIDDGGPLPAGEFRRIDARGAAAMARQNIRQPIATGIRVIDGLLTCGRGQRMGIFSGPGIGKSTMLASIARNTNADVIVVALIGERTREVQEFIEKGLGKEGMKRCCVVVSTSDDSPLMCVRAAKVAATISEYFRDEGNHVLLLVDSLTRLCHAQRQIGLAAQEPPAARGYPPSVFALLPQILERAGNTPTGSITGFYSVLVEGDDFNEPIADAVRGIADGHLWLSRALASKGHFPAIDVLQSISRVREDVVDEQHLKAARRILCLLAGYQEIQDLVSVGAYVPGVNRDIDVAVNARPRILQYLQQDATAAMTLEESRRQLLDLVAEIDRA